MLDVLIEHCYAEVRDHDVERTMATLVEDCVYHWRGDKKTLASWNKRPGTWNREEVRADYEAGMMSGQLAMDSMGTDIDHFFITDDAVAWAGTIHAAVPGRVLVGAGFSLPAGGTEQDSFRATYRAVMVVPFRDGLMVGEDFYVDGLESLAKIDE